jgi:hypothetical protein
VERPVRLSPRRPSNRIPVQFHPKATRHHDPGHSVARPKWSPRSHRIA